MKKNISFEDVQKYQLEDWVRIFGRIYKKADAERTASSLWLDVIDESANIAEFVRRDEYKKAIDNMPNVFCRLLCFVAKYSINLTDDILEHEGINLSSPDYNENCLTEWVLRKFPCLCSVCAKKPCVCPSSRADVENRDEEFKIGEVITARMLKHKSWEIQIEGKINTFSLEKLFDMFCDIYGGVHYDPPISSICFHFLEEVGEVAKLLLALDNIQIMKTQGNGKYEDDREYLNNNLKEEISDVISWIGAIINKINYIFRSTYPHYHCLLDESSCHDKLFQRITPSELIFNRYFDNVSNQFICPHCRSSNCSPSCKQRRLIAETEKKEEK